MRALRVQVRGQVQGVGFRPFVHRLAIRHGLGGWVRNESGAVEIEIEGGEAELAKFLHGLKQEAPPLARIEEVRAVPCVPAGCERFSIVGSIVRTDERLPVPPDTALCAACEAELFDPADRRYRYPFITCTDCGPRFTVIEALPYDRERTSMAVFPQCLECLREYQDPNDRRYRSETNSCPACGPRLWFEAGGTAAHAADGEDALEAAARLVGAGGVLALRGLGGFHLVVDATREGAVSELRRRKRREAKPLAIMTRTLAQVRAVAEVSEEEASLLCSAERPVVLLRRTGPVTLAPSLAPGLDTIGVMLAYTPLHHLLLELTAGPLVMTSGNRSEEPIGHRQRRGAPPAR